MRGARRAWPTRIAAAAAVACLAGVVLVGAWQFPSGATSLWIRAAVVGRRQFRV